MRVRFLETVIYETEGPGKGPVYQADSVHDLPEDKAQRWLRRGKAVVEQSTPETPTESKGRAKLKLAGQGD